MASSAFFRSASARRRALRASLFFSFRRWCLLPELDDDVEPRLERSPLELLSSVALPLLEPEGEPGFR